MRLAGRGRRRYRVLVATHPELLADGKADVWDSGKVTSAQSLNVKYAGPAVKPSTRYWWRVEVWGADGKSLSGERSGVVGDGFTERERVAWRMDRLGDGGRGCRAEGASSVGGES